MASTQLTLFSSPDDAQNPAPDEGLTIRTGNRGLASAEVSTDGYGSPLVRFVLDSSMDDWRWRLYDGGRPAGPGRDIERTVGFDIRKAIAKHEGRPVPKK